MPDNYLESGLNLLYWGDFHYQEKAPTKRTDDFHETEFRKARLIQELARKHKVRAHLEGGDFLDKPRISDGFMQKILANWNFKQGVKNREDYENGLITKEEYAERSLAQIPIIGIVGNHEVFGGALKNYNRTSLKTLNDMGFINLVGRKKPYIFTMENGKTVAVSGQSYDLRLLQNPDNFMLKQKFGDVDIFMVHEALYNTQLSEGMNWMPISKVDKGTVADVTIAGHIHNGFGWVESSGRIFGNPGVPAQQSAAKTELDRDIVVTLIHVSEDCQVYIEDIVLDTPRSRDLFDLTTSEEDKEHEEQMARVQEIIDSVDQISETKAIDIIKKVAKTDGVDKSILELAVSTTDEVMQASGDHSTLEDGVDYRVNKVILENFESHLFTEVELPQEGPTVLIGESSHGKSSILRGIYWCLENEGSSMDFIRRAPGVTKASVTLERVDGLRVTRFVEKKKKRNGGWKVSENGWEVVEPSGKSYQTNTQGLSQIQRLFGLTYLQLDQKDSIGINFQKQEDPWFFIGLNSQQRAKVIGAIYGTQHILGGIKSLESQRRAKESEKKVVASDLAGLNTQLEPLKDVEAQQRIIGKLSKLCDILDEHTKLNSTLSGLNSELVANKHTGKVTEDFLNEVVLTGDMSALMTQLRSLKVMQSTLTEFNTVQAVIQSESDKLKEQASWAEFVTEQKSQLAQLSKLDADLKILSRYLPVLEKGKRLIATHVPVVESKEQVDVTKADMAKLVATKTASKAVSSYLQVAETWSRDCDILNHLVKQDRARIDADIREVSTIRSKLTSLTEILKELCEIKTELTKGDEYVKAAFNEANELKRLIVNRQAELKYSHKYQLGDLVVYGVKEVVIGDETMTNDETLKDFQERLEAINRKTIQAEARLVEIRKRQDEAEGKIRALGIEPDEAQAKLEELNQEIAALEVKIDKNLTHIEDIAAKMEV